MNGPRKHNLILGIYPNTRGFSFVLFEGPEFTADWGTMEVRGKLKNRQCLRRISVLLGRYQPDALVLQDMSEYGTRRARRICNLNEAIEVLAETQGIQVFKCSRAQVQRAFSSLGATTKQAIAQSISTLIPVFGNFIPPVRKIWKSEHSRMALFDAAALVLTFYRQAGTHSDQATTSN
jgi:Holliday junction resolvasome RuvABC endonuclease subunit